MIIHENGFRVGRIKAFLCTDVSAVDTRALLEPALSVTDCGVFTCKANQPRLKLCAVRDSSLLLYRTIGNVTASAVPVQGVEIGNGWNTRVQSLFGEVNSCIILRYPERNSYDKF
jgi:hypothetical protein